MAALSTVCYNSFTMSKASEKTTVISISTGTIFKILVIAATLAFLWFVKEIVIMLLLAVLLASLIEPAVDWLHQRKVPRALSVLGLYVIIFTLLTLSLILIIPPFVEQITQLSANFGDVSKSVSEWVGKAVAIGQQYGLAEGVQSSLQTLQGNINGIVGNVLSTISGIVGGVAALVIILVLTFYIVIEEDAWRRIFRRVAPDEYQPYLTQMFGKMQTKMGMWLRGQLLLMLVIGLASFIGLTILGIPYALVLALFAGLMEMVPYAGPTMSAIPMVMIAFGESPLKALTVLLLCLIIQQMENNILVPKIMQKVTGLNPIVSIVALLIGFKIGGVPGAALSIPVATMASVFVYDVFREVAPKHVEDHHD